MTDQTQPNSAKAQILNDRTYQEVEYLKKNLGPILVAALAEICIRRPADPIEYLGHWLLRWRYNEELKRRDVQNALEVLRQKAQTKDEEGLQPNTATLPGDQALTFTQGFVPGAPHAPPGYGGPLDQNVVEEVTKPKPEAEVPPEVEKVPSGGDEAPTAPRKSGGEEPAPAAVGSGEQQVNANGEAGAEGQAEPAGDTQFEENAPAAVEEKRLSQPREDQGSGGAINRTSLGGQQQARLSGEVPQGARGSVEQPPPGERRASRKSEPQDRRQSTGPRGSNAEAEADAPPPAE